MSTASPESPKTTLPTAFSNQDPDFQLRNAQRRKRNSRWFYVLCVAIAMVSVAVLVVLLFSIGVQGSSRVSSGLLTQPHSELDIENAGMGPSIIGSLFVCTICAAVSLPLGIGTAIFLEEFKPRGKMLRWLHGFVNLNIANLAGVPSIVYGLLGLSAFVFMFSVFGEIKVNESSGLELMGAKHYYQLLSLESGQTVFVQQTDLSKSTIEINEPTQGFDGSGNPIEIQLWTPGTPKPTDTAERLRTVRMGGHWRHLHRTRLVFLSVTVWQKFSGSGINAGIGDFAGHHYRVTRIVKGGFAILAGSIPRSWRNHVANNSKCDFTGCSSWYYDRGDPGDGPSDWRSSAHLGCAWRHDCQELWTTTLDGQRCYDADPDLQLGWSTPRCI